MYCVTMSPHVSNKHVCTLCVPNILQKLTTIYQYQSNKIIAIGVNKRLFDIQLVTIKYVVAMTKTSYKKCCMYV